MSLPIFVVVVLKNGGPWEIRALGGVRMRPVCVQASEKCGVM